jgi:hypothetical protein
VELPIFEEVEAEEPEEPEFGPTAVLDEAELVHAVTFRWK